GEDLHEGAHVVEAASDEKPQVATIIDELADETNSRGPVIRGDRIEQCARLLPLGDAEELVYVGDADVANRERRDHVEDALGIPQRTLCVACDRLKRRGF